jgi:predicted AAA+ superfamily ATPase
MYSPPSILYFLIDTSNYHDILKHMYIHRAQKLPPAGTETFFLWGPRQTGKSTLLRHTYREAVWIDLLKAEEYRRYMQQPELLRQELSEEDRERQIVIDEIQKVPALLDEVHWIFENRGFQFALCGSSARKVKRGAANLLGGRAVRYELHGLVASELKREFELDRMLNHGYLPRIYASSRPRSLLDAYIADYLKEEVAAESLVRNLPVFSEFLNIAALSDTELVNFSTIARECGVSSHTVKAYFGILEDTLLGRWLPAYRKRPKRRVIGAPKFYFADVGLVNRLARRGTLQPGSELFGKAFENWIFHELVAYNAYADADAIISYWRLPSGIEVDFIINDMQLAIEAKSSARITNDHLKGLRNVAQDHGEVKRRLVVCLEQKARRTDDGIEILPVSTFVKSLSRGELF